MQKFTYPSEKFSVARSSLMLPHPRGEAASIASAFHECSLGLHDVRDEDLDNHARGWVAKLRELMDTSGIQDPTGRGMWLIKAEQLSEEEKFELSRIVDELAHWFRREHSRD